MRSDGRREIAFRFSGRVVASSNNEEKIVLSRFAASVVCVGMAAFGTSAPAQDKFPSKVIRIVTAAPGSNHDWGARLVAHELTPRINQRVIVENRGSISTEYVAKEAPADGYTLLFYGAYTWLQPLLQKVNWDPVADLAPITLAISSPNVLVVHPSLPVKSVKDLVALARTRPGQLNYAAGGGGSTPHIAAELFKYMAKVDITRVNYKGSGPSMIGLLTGETQLMFAALGPVMPHVKAGKMRAIAVTTPKRTQLTPELPTVAETLPGYASEAAIGLFAPRRTPPAIMSYLNREVVQALKASDPQKIFNAGVHVVANSPEEFGTFIKSDMAKMGEVMKGAGFSN
jgi:tripartite-type tricarboxylate transporter receptor subunit TctC